MIPDSDRFRHGYRAGLADAVHLLRMWQVGREREHRGEIISDPHSPAAVEATHADHAARIVEGLRRNKEDEWRKQDAATR